MNLKKEFEKNKDLVTLKESKVYPGLFVLKYKKKVFFNDSWNDFLREARGLVVDSNWNIVSYPFTKIHNYGVEESAPEFHDNELVWVSDKINGFMIAATWYKGDILWSTTGSLDSDFVGLAKEIFDSWSGEQQEEFSRILRESPNTTFMFECCHPNDPHIVEEEEGLYYLGSRLKSIGSIVFLERFLTEKFFWGGTGVRIIQNQLMYFWELKDIVEQCDREGFVFCDEGRSRYSKIKSKYYLTKKFLMRGSKEKILAPNPKMLFDEEFYGLVEKLKTIPSFFDLCEKDKRAFIEEHFYATK